ncbi:hypothetical protein ACEPAF_3027 [Sanghuangporus sanghuang]
MPPERSNAKSKRGPAPHPRPPSQAAAPSSDATLQDSSPTSEVGDETITRRPRLITRELLTKKGRGKRKPRETDDPKVEILTLAKFIKRGIDPWLYVPVIMNAGNAAATLKRYESLSTTDPRYDEEEKQKAEKIIMKSGSDRDNLLKAYDGIIALFADHMEYILGLSHDDQEILWYEVNLAADKARAYDTNKTKERGHRYILKTGTPNPPVDCDAMKMNHGTNHPQFLRAIVPMSILYRHSDDPMFEDMVKAREFTIDHKSMPAFMFDMEDYRPRSAKKTLLRGHMPVRVCKQIFTSPSSALEDQPGRKRATRPGNAKIAGQNKVTPEMIAYACIQSRHYLSTLDSWGEWDKSFNTKAFYYGICGFFKKRDAKWVKETLQWWNDKVFGPPQEDGPEEHEEDENDETSLANILASIEDDDDNECDGNDSDNSNGNSSNSNSNSNSNNNEPDAPSQTQPDSQYSRNAFPSQS